MDNEQHLPPPFQDRDRNTSTGRPTSGSARQFARHKGLVWVSAITLGAGAASALGATAIVMSLPSVSAATSTTAAVTGTSTNAGSTQQASLKSAAAPTSTSVAPVATSGAS